MTDFLVAQMAKNLPAMQETLVQSLGQEDPLEKGMATHSSTLAWRISKTEEPWWAAVMGLQKEKSIAYAITICELSITHPSYLYNNSLCVCICTHF